MQVRPEKTVNMNESCFNAQDYTSIYWLGNAGILMNVHGTVLMIDPILSGFDMPLLIDMPISEENVKKVDGMLITHCDNDHFCVECQNKLTMVTKSYHTTNYVSSLFKERMNVEANGYYIGESFMVDDVRVTLTPADHNWQNFSSKHHTREFLKEDYCGFYIETKDGNIFNVGDTRFLNILTLFKEPDVLILDFSDSKWHIGFDNAVTLCNAYPNAKIIPTHWGSVDAENWKEFNGNPWLLKEKICNPERLFILNPGEEFILGKE